MLLIFKKSDRKPGVAIRRPRKHEEGMPIIVIPYDRTIEKEELDYTMEGQIEKERERIAKGKPLSEKKRERDAEAEYERNKITGGAPIWGKPE